MYVSHSCMGRHKLRNLNNASLFKLIYIFLSELQKEVQAYKAANPGAEVFTTFEGMEGWGCMESITRLLF